MSQHRTLLPGVNAARITPPIVPPHLIRRDDLLEQLEVPVPHATYIVAPSGYGKTTLASQWAAMHPTNTVWHTASLADDPKTTLFHFIESFRRCWPNFAPWAESIVNKELDVAEVVRLVANEVSTLGPIVNFIVDGAEYYSADHAPMMEIWQANAPLNLRTVTTRTSIPAITPVRAASLNVLKVINAADLKLNQEEIESLAEYYEVDLKDNKKRMSVDLAQGWPSGVNIILKGIQSGIVINEEMGIDRLKSLDSRTLVRTAISSLKESERNFLYEMSLFPAIRPEYVASKMGDSSARNTLRRMSADGTFISEFGVDENTFLINPIIKDVINEDLTRDENSYKALCKITAEILLENNQDIEAIDLLMAAGEVARVKNIVAQNTRRMIYSNQGDLLRRWRKVVADVLGLEEVGEQLVEAYAAMVSESLESCKTKYTTLLRAANGTNDFTVIEGDLGVMESRIKFSEGAFSKCIEGVNVLATKSFTKEALSSSKAITGLRFAASAALLSEDLESLREIAKIAENLNFPRNEKPLVALSAIQACVALGEGRMKDCRDLALYTLNLSAEYGYTGLLAPYDVTYCLAESSREFGRDQEALDFCSSLIDSAKEHDLYPWVAAFSAKAALLTAQTGRVSDSLKTLREIRDYLSNPLLDLQVHRIVDEHELFIRVIAGDTERIEELLYRLPRTTTIVAFVAGIAARKNPTQALSLIEALPGRTVREEINKEILLADYYVTQPVIAREHIHNALRLALPHGHRRIFLSQTYEFKNILLDFASDHPSVYVESLASAIRENMKERNLKGGGLANPLTKRELDILRRLPTGLPITQIASTLHISNNTIKTHLKNVYKKLGVDSRDAAVTKGKELLLL